MGRPKTERPEDPLAQVQARARGALPPIGALQRRNVEPAAVTLASAVKRLEQLDAAIAKLNGSKRDIYAELKARGFDTATVKRALKERRVDPLVRVERQSIFETYWDAIFAAMDAADETEFAENAA